MGANVNWALAAVNFGLHAGFVLGAVFFFRVPRPVPVPTKGLVLVSPGLAAGGAWAVASGPPVPLALGVAAVLAVASAGLFAWAAGTAGRKRLGACFAANAPSELIADGPYRYVRNPFYTSYLLAHVSTVVASGNPWLAPVAAGLGVLYVAAAVREEREFLVSPLRDRYLAYRARTGRFLPRVW